MRSPETVAGMACPVCRSALAMTERQGIEIDYCPSCRGIWLDRGELDKIIERSTAAEPSAPAPAPQAAPSPWQSQPQGGYRDDDRRGYDDGRRYPGKRRKSFLEELFD